MQFGIISTGDKMANKNALVVLSGGQDSTTCLFWAKLQYENVYSISFDYGQRHRIELDSATEIAKLANVVRHSVIEIPKEMLKSASPLNSNNKLDEYGSFSEMQQKVGNSIEKTFVPMRNTLFLTIAANHAVTIGNCDLVTGICQEDNANYPDCTELFRYSMQQTINQSLGTDVDNYMFVKAPLMFKSKAETCRMSLELPGCYNALAFTHTSYDGIYPPVGNNHSNLLRAKGFELAAIPDPLVIRAWAEGKMKLPSSDNYSIVRLYNIGNLGEDVNLDYCMQFIQNTFKNQNLLKD
jgi:7-cyano-7-deazaguanine synthase